MKKVACILICVVGLICLSSCRSSASSCGLADNINQTQVNIQQQINIVQAI